MDKLIEVQLIWLSKVFPKVPKLRKKNETKYDRDNNFVCCFEVFGSDRPILNDDAIPFFFFLDFLRQLLTFFLHLANLFFQTQDLAILKVNHFILRHVLKEVLKLSSVYRFADDFRGQNKFVTKYLHLIIIKIITNLSL